MNKTLYISDLDGTLLNHKAEVSDYTSEALNGMMAGGLKFSIATARTAASALKIMKGIYCRVPLILMNGVLIYDPIQKHYTRILSLYGETVIAITALLNQMGVTGLMYKMAAGKQVTYYESLRDKPIRDFVEERINRYNKAFTQTDRFDMIPSEDVIYFTLLNHENKIRYLYEQLKNVPGLNLSMYKDIYSPELWYLELHSDLASKQSGIDFLRNEYGFEQVVSFGDNLNDLPMFAASDVRIAVENAKPEVKAAATEICGTNEADGVVKWLENNISLFPPVSYRN